MIIITRLHNAIFAQIANSVERKLDNQIWLGVAQPVFTITRMFKIYSEHLDNSIQ